MRTKHVIGLVLAMGLGIGAVVFAITSAEQYVTFDEASASNRTVQVKGSWEKGAEMSYSPDENIFLFSMVDESGKTVPVRYAGAKPNNFEMAEEIVVGGRLVEGTFEATHVLTKCPSKYEAESIEVPNREV